jgi:hypothetical protein
MCTMVPERRNCRPTRTGRSGLASGSNGWEFFSVSESTGARQVRRSIRRRARTIPPLGKHRNRAAGAGQVAGAGRAEVVANGRSAHPRRIRLGPIGDRRRDGVRARGCKTIPIAADRAAPPALAAPLTKSSAFRAEFDRRCFAQTHIRSPRLAGGSAGGNRPEAPAPTPTASQAHRSAPAKETRPAGQCPLLILYPRALVVSEWRGI